jgi:hypothetical protein
VSQLDVDLDRQPGQPAAALENRQRLGREPRAHAKRARRLESRERPLHEAG